jgi:4-hydroxybenzoate polyprenyltransferase
MVTGSADADAPSGQAASSSRIRRAAQVADGLLRACHPEPAAAVTLVSILLAVAAGRGAGGSAAVGSAVLATQLSVGWTNDWFDTARDVATGRTDKPIVSGRVSRRTVGIGAIISGLAVVPLALLSGPAAAVVITIAYVSALLYDWPLKATAFSVLPYIVSFGLLVAFPVVGRPDDNVPPWWIDAAGALLGGGAHFANVLPDMDDDVRTGVRGLPHRIGRGPSTVVAAAGLLAATGVLAFGPSRSPSWFAVGAFVAAVVVLPIGWYVGRAPGSRAPFRAVLVVAMIDIVLLLTNGHLS